MKNFKKKSITIKIAIAITLTMLFAQQAHAASQSVSINGLTTRLEVENVLTPALAQAVSGDVITVTGSANLTDAQGVTISAIPAGVTVNWQAQITGTTGETSTLITINSGGGTFDVATGGSVTNNGGHGIWSYGTVTVKVSGGSVTAYNGGIFAGDASNTGVKTIITGGTVKSNATRAIESYGAVEIGGGRV